MKLSNSELAKLKQLILQANPSIFNNEYEFAYAYSSPCPCGGTCAGECTGAGCTGTYEGCVLFSG